MSLIRLFGVCVSVPSCGTTHVSCGGGEHRLRVALSNASAFVSVLPEQVRFGGSCAPVFDLESYSYRIGTVHMCRDAAYADAGVRSGAFKRTFVLNFSGVA